MQRLFSRFCKDNTQTRRVVDRKYDYSYIEWQHNLARIPDESLSKFDKQTLQNTKTNKNIEKQPERKDSKPKKSLNI